MGQPGKSNRATRQMFQPGADKNDANWATRKSGQLGADQPAGEASETIVLGCIVPVGEVYVTLKVRQVRKNLYLDFPSFAICVT